MLTAEDMEPADHVHVNAGRLWAGGVATAIVAALAVLAGVLNPLDAVGGQDRDTLAAEVTSHAFSSIPF